MQSLTMRGFRRSDRRAVLALIAADRLPGQPRPTATALVSALAARGPDGRPQARALQPPVTEILLDERRRITGVISYALRPYDDAGVVLWAHAAEDPSTMAVLMGWARVRLGPDRPWYAFPGIPATGTTEGLAGSRRPATTHALRTTGFTAIAERRYWNRDLRRNPPTGPLPRPLATAAPQHGPAASCSGSPERTALRPPKPASTPRTAAPPTCTAS
ncbi:hypothetical protein [Kitasatospora sp. NPDC051914]|uniref:hypothetical protein n=1 Tax=Kitasatospora sp. NPDC051914 TaxID=3154945 RepID=UPI00343F8043